MHRGPAVEDEPEAADRAGEPRQLDGLEPHVPSVPRDDRVDQHRVARAHGQEQAQRCDAWPAPGARPVGEHGAVGREHHVRGDEVGMEQRLGQVLQQVEPGELVAERLVSPVGEERFEPGDVLSAATSRPA